MGKLIIQDDYNKINLKVGFFKKVTVDDALEELMATLISGQRVNDLT